MAAWRAYKCVKQVEFLSNGSHVGSDKWVMAPLAELLNHQPFSGHIQWQDNDVSSGVFQIISDRHYNAGEQVLRYSYALLYSELLSYDVLYSYHVLYLFRCWCDSLFTPAPLLHARVRECV